MNDEKKDIADHSMSMKKRENIKVSVVIPVYNAEPYLRKCLDSVLTQSMKEIEVICIDDCSDDRSLRILQEYARTDDRVSVIANPTNQKAGICRNTGIDHASGKYVFFLDADDSMLPGALEALYHTAEELGADIVRARCFAWDNATNQRVHSDRYELSKVPGELFNKLLSFQENIHVFLDRVPVVPWGGIVRRSYLVEQGIRFNHLTCLQDRAFYIDIILHNDKIALIRDYIVCHTINNAGSLIDIRCKHFDCHFESIRLIKNAIAEESDNIRAAIYTSEIRDMISWFTKYQNEHLDELFDVTKEFLQSYDKEIEIIKAVFPNCISRKWYKVCSEILRYDCETYARLYVNGYSKEDFENSPEVVADKQKAVIRDLVNFEKRPSEPVKVSVIVPVCNAEQHLEECLESIVSQTLTEMEVICVNDGSADGSLDILKRFAEKDDRIKVIDKEQSGFGHSLNLGMDMAQGEYIGFVKSDSLVHSEMYQVLYQTAKENNDLDFVRTDFERFVRVKGKDVCSHIRFFKNDNNYLGVTHPLGYLMIFSFENLPPCSIYRTEFIRKRKIRHNEMPYPLFRNNVFDFMVFAEADRCVFLNQPFYMDRRTVQNSSDDEMKKIDCMMNELGCIRQYTDNHAAYAECFLPFYFRQKLLTYSTIIPLLPMTEKQDFLKQMQQELLKADAEEKLQEKSFSEKEWKSINLIMETPEEYSNTAIQDSIKVSVILPVYNAAEFLPRCLESFLSQTLEEFEIICINDGSTDDSLSVIQEYANADERIICIDQENAGAGKARNVGMEKASGQYLCFPDADDYVAPDLLKKSYELSEKYQTDICVFGSNQLDAQTGVVKPCRFSVRTATLPNKKVFCLEDISVNPLNCFVGWAWDKFYRRSFVMEHHLQFQEQRTTNDMYFVMVSLLKAERITYLPDRLYYQQRNNPNSLSSTRHLSWECFYYALEKVRNEMIDMGIYDKYEKEFINFALRRCIWNLTTIHEKEAALLFDRLREEWFSNLGIRDYGAAFYDNPGNYEQLILILQATEHNGCPAYYDYIIRRLKLENEKLNSPKRLIRITNGQSLPLDSLIQKLDWNREQKKILSEKLQQIEEILKK